MGREDDRPRQPIILSSEELSFQGSTFKCLSLSSSVPCSTFHVFAFMVASSEINSTAGIFVSWNSVVGVVLWLPSILDYAVDGVMM